MAMWDNSDFKVQMSGKEYLEYKKYNASLPPMFDKKQVIGIMIILVSVIAGVIAIGYINQVFEIKELTTPSSSEMFLRSINSPADLSWNNLAKLFFITHIQIIGVIVILIGLAWVIHGFGFIIIKR